MAHSKIYGHAFQNVRNQKQVSLSYFELMGFSKGNISKFERGEIMMGFEKVDVLLQLMNVSLGEYELVLNNFVQNYQDEMIKILEEADVLGDKKRLNQLLQESYEETNYWLVLAIKACTVRLSQEECEKVTEYLYRVKVWGYFELSIAYFVLDNLAVENIKELLHVAQEKNQNYFGIFKYRRRLLQICYRAVSLFIASGDQEYANQILNATSTQHSEHDMYINNLRKLAASYFEYEFGEKEEGKIKLKRTLELFEELDGIAARKYYENRLKNLSKEQFQI